MSGSAALNASILVVEDDPGTGRFLSDTLTSGGYRVAKVADGRGAMNALGQAHFDLVILDLGLPDMDGMDLLRTIRQWDQMPLILVVSARGQEADKVSALRAGADDYLAKPFGTQELLARVEARLRRQEQDPVEMTLELGSLRIELGANQIILRGARVRLTPMEKGVLQDLMRHRGRVRSHREILNAVWGPGFTSEHAYVRTIVQRLRAKLELQPDAPDWIVTVPGVGYLFQTAPERPPVDQPPR
ncbi:MAG TPA: response regulator transcription factor [Candidatus Dormibacteraeota bacterium]|nr:response regulator transcription factor [Candidatus Dormibacteraeota bacterium]